MAFSVFFFEKFQFRISNFKVADSLSVLVFLSRKFAKMIRDIQIGFLIDVHFVNSIILRFTVFVYEGIFGR